VIEGVKGDEFMLEDDDKVESLNFKSKLDELFEGLSDFVKENLRINKNRVKEALTQFSHALILLATAIKCVQYDILIFNLWSSGR
jgi:hypothetical protein